MSEIRKYPLSILKRGLNDSVHRRVMSAQLCLIAKTIMLCQGDIIHTDIELENIGGGLVGHLVGNFVTRYLSDIN